MSNPEFDISVKIAGGERDYVIGSFSVAKPEGGVPTIEAAVGLVNTVGPMLAPHIFRTLSYGFVRQTYIHKGSVGMEVGVDRGDGLALWLTGEPSLIHAVDPWLHKDDDDWYGCGQEEMDERYRRVCFRYRNVAEVELHRTTSDEYFKTLKDDCLDWCFVDGDHREDAAYRDIVNAVRCVKNGGHILVDDVHNSDWRKEITAAIDRACKDTGKLGVSYNTNDPVVLQVMK